MNEVNMTIKAGDRLPNVDVGVMGSGGPETTTTDEIFSGRKVLVFGLPGAFTPTCSAAHLPGYVVHNDAIKAKGVDTIACVSVNDAFVMDAWGKSQNVDGKILMVADGSAAFSEAVGLVLDLTARGMGIRSRRYAMIVDDCVVTHLNVDEGANLEVSDAETMMALL